MLLETDLHHHIFCHFFRSVRNSQQRQYLSHFDVHMTSQLASPPSHSYGSFIPPVLCSSEDIDPPPEDTTDSSGPAGAARAPSPAAAASNKLRKGIRSIRRRMKRGGRCRSDPDPDTGRGPETDPAPAEGSGSSGEDPPELRGSVSTDSFPLVADERGG